MLSVEKETLRLYGNVKQKMHVLTIPAHDPAVFRQCPYKT